MKAQPHVSQYVLCMSLLQNLLRTNKIVGDKNGLISVLLCICTFICAVSTKWCTAVAKLSWGLLY